MSDWVNCQVVQSLSRWKVTDWIFQSISSQYYWEGFLFWSWAWWWITASSTARDLVLVRRMRKRSVDSRGASWICCWSPAASKWTGRCRTEVSYSRPLIGKEDGTHPGIGLLQPWQIRSLLPTRLTEVRQRDSVVRSSIGKSRYTPWRAKRARAWWAWVKSHWASRIFSISFNRPPCSHHSFSNISLGAPHAGQTQSSGSFSKGVPGETPESGSPLAGS